MRRSLSYLIAFLSLSAGGCGSSSDIQTLVNAGSPAGSAANPTANPGSSRTIARVNLDSAGNQADGQTISSASLSQDGRFVLFFSAATNLVPGDTNNVPDVFVRDRQTDTTTIVSVDSMGNRSNDFSSVSTVSGGSNKISATGRFVVFESSATNLVTGDNNASTDVFVHDRQTGATTRVSVDSNGNEGNGGSVDGSISADGRFVAFTSFATNLVTGDTNNFGDIFVRDRQNNTTTRVSISSGLAQADSTSFIPSISADGRFVSFTSSATNLVAGDTNAVDDIFVHDRQTQTTSRVSLNTNGTQGDMSSLGSCLSSDGRWVGFSSSATNLVSGDTNNRSDVFVRDRQTNTTTRVSLDSAGNQGNDSSFSASISGDGRLLTFASLASNLVTGDFNGVPDIFLRDVQNGTTVRLSLDLAGNEGNRNSLLPSISGDGTLVAFLSLATNLVPFDVNGFNDVFVARP